MSGHVWLIGMMGSGKSTVAGLLGRRLGLPVVDVDAEIEARLGCSIGQLWGERGEPAFRDLEAAAIARVAPGEPSVVATGGGVVLDADNVARMRVTGSLIWLTASPAVLRRRVGAEEGRPLLDDGDRTARLEAILDARREAYADAADLVLDTEGLTPSQIAERIEEWWSES
jgi:shikimate kinase